MFAKFRLQRHTCGQLFTLRESRRGRLEAGGWETRCSVNVKSSKIGARSHPKSLLEAAGGIKTRCQEHREQQVGPPGPSRAPILTPGRLIWALLGLNLELRGSWCCPDVPFWVPKASILRVPGHPEAAFCRFCSKFAEFMKTIEKPRFSHDFSMISKVWRVSKSMTNMKK